MVCEVQRFSVLVVRLVTGYVVRVTLHDLRFTPVPMNRDRDHVYRFTQQCLEAMVVGVDYIIPSVISFYSLEVG